MNDHTTNSPESNNSTKPSPFLGVGMIASAAGLAMLFTDDPSFGYKVGLSLGQILVSAILALPIFLIWRYATKNGRIAKLVRAFNVYATILVATWFILFVVAKNMLPSFAAGYEAGKGSVHEAPASGSLGMGFPASTVAPEALPTPPVVDGSIMSVGVSVEAPAASGGDVVTPAKVAERWLTSQEWIESSPQRRKQIADDFAVIALSEMQQHKGITIGGKPAFKPDGSYTDDGLELLSRTKAYFKAAANIPSGGATLNPYTKKFEALYGMDQMFMHPAEPK